MPEYHADRRKKKNNWILFSEVLIYDKILFLDLDSVINMQKELGILTTWSTTHTCYIPGLFLRSGQRKFGDNEANHNWNNTII